LSESPRRHTPPTTTSPTTSGWWATSSAIAGASRVRATASRWWKGACNLGGALSGRDIEAENKDGERLDQAALPLRAGAV